MTIAKITLHCILKTAISFKDLQGIKPFNPTNIFIYPSGNIRKAPVF